MSGSPDINWQAYEPYKWFMEKVGGPEALVPRKDGLPLMLRIHFRELAGIPGSVPEMDPNTTLLVKSIDEFYGFNDRSVLGYSSSNEKEDDTNPAHLFFISTALGPVLAEEFKVMLERKEKQR